MKKHLYPLLLISSLLLLQQTVPAQLFWKASGNTGTNPSYNFLGTKDIKGLVLRTNNIMRIFISSSGNVGIGITQPTQKLEVGGNMNIAGGSGYYIDHIRILHMKEGNFFAGPFTGYSNTSGFENMGCGTSALFSNTSGNQNTAVGFSALHANTVGSSNTAMGNNALDANTTGSDNTAVGLAALCFNTTGSYNSAFGSVSLFTNTTGSENTASGIFALLSNGSGQGNTATGYAALRLNTSGNYNSAVGYFADLNDTNLTNSTAIGNNSLITASNQVRIGNSSVTSIGGYTNWSNISDGRYKKNVKENIPGLAFINMLRPITYNLKIFELDNWLRRNMPNTDKNGKQILKQTDEQKNAMAEKEKIIYSGFIAQDVEKAAKEIGYDFSGVDAPKNENDVYGLRYADFVVPLVKAVQELSKENDELKSRLDKLEAIVSHESQSSVSQNIELGSVAVLEQNIPNPSSGTTTINYYLPINSGNTYINFYSSSGALLKSVKLYSEGHGSINVKSSELPAGVYQYSLLIKGKVIDTKQMVLAK